MHVSMEQLNIFTHSCARQHTPLEKGTATDGTAPVGTAKRTAVAQRWRHIDPVVPFTDAEELSMLADFYGWESSALPLGEQLITRSQPGIAKPKRLYFVNAGTALPCGSMSLLGSE